MITISQSEMSSWARCPRKWFVTYYLGYRRAEESATGSWQLGNRVHVALEGHYGYQLDALTVLQLLYQTEMKARPDDAEALAAERDLAMAMTEGYLEWTAAEGADADLEPLATEAEVQVPMPGMPEVTLRARLDALFRRVSDSKVLFLDHKTAASFDRHEILALDVQMRFYAMIQHLQAAGQPGAPLVGGGLINTLRRCKRSDRSKPPYYQRDEFTYNPEQISSMLARTRQLCAEILNARQALDWAYSQGAGVGEALNIVQRSVLRAVPMLDNCGWSCPLASGLCAMMDDGSDWAGSLSHSGHWVQADPYDYYRDRSLQTIREELAKL